MKKSYLILAAAATMFAACSQDTLIDESVELAQGGEKAITFGTFAGTQVKAGEAENSNATEKKDLSIYHNSFYVWGNKVVGATSPTYTSVFVGSEDGKGQATIKYVSDWTYAPLRYWDKSADHYDFYAAAPVTQAWTASKNTPLDSEDDLKFALATFITDGKSLAQSAENPTGHALSVFYTDNTK